jgi:diacylglycerol kinase family enzyme
VPPNLHAPLKVALVANSGSGSMEEGDGSIGRHFSRKEEVSLAFDGADFDEVSDAVHGAVAAETDIIVSAGGDGTARLIADTMIAQESKAALLVLPCGTANLLSKRLHGEQTVEALIDGVTQLTTTHIPAGFVNDQIFLLAAAAGFPAAMGRAREAFRDAPARPRRMARTFGAAAVALRRLLQPRLRLASDGLAGGARKASGVIAWIDPAETAPASRKTKPRLTCLSIGPESWGDVFSLAGSAMAGTLSDAERAAVFQATEIQLRSRRPIQVMLDGEPQFVSPDLSIQIKPKALKVLTAVR